MVILMVKATPVLSSLMSDLTNDEGVIVGKGPPVSVGVTVHEPEPDPVLVLVPVPVPVSEPVDETSSFLQAAMITGTDVAPIRKFLRNFFLDSIVFTFLFKEYGVSMKT